MSIVGGDVPSAEVPLKPAIDEIGIGRLPRRDGALLADEAEDGEAIVRPHLRLNTRVQEGIATEETEAEHGLLLRIVKPVILTQRK